MTKRSQGKALSRRHFFKLTGGSTLFAAGMGLLPFKNLLGPLSMADASAQAVTVNPPPDLYFGGTDGWISLPKNPEVRSASLGGVKTHPDDLAPTDLDTLDGKGLTTYIFGFRNVTGLSDAQRAAQKNHAQHNAPMFWLDQFNPASPKDFRINLTNLGLALRPDLFDAHTIHWHGFRNVITFFDGEPTGSIAVTAGRVFQYVYRPRDPGTYMFHCHVEDVEHVHMGMTGPVFVRPLQNSTGGAPFGGAAPVSRLGGASTGPMGYAYNCGDGSTAYDREFAIFCSEVWGDSHWADAHIQLPEWSDYRADFCLLNGRVYPDTLAPNAPMTMPGALSSNIHAMPVITDADGDLTTTPGYEYLKYQPLSALVTCNAGDRVLLRFANLGFKESAMTLDGPRMRVVGKDATPMRGIGPDNKTRNGADTSYEASTVSFGAGESIDAIFVAPAFSGGLGTSGQGYDVYLLYDRAYERTNNLAATSTGLPYGGRQTEVRVYPGTLGQQLLPNT
jgi:FtsP/CotA-like multicopper oxidase with cupredoxin domain